MLKKTEVYLKDLENITKNDLITEDGMILYDHSGYDFGYKNSNDIKEILKKIKSVSNFDDYVDFVGTEFKPLLDYIINLQCDVDSYKTKYENAKENLKFLQEENEKLKEDMKIKDDIISITYDKDTKEYILDRKNYYKINKRLNERLDYKSRIDKAIKILNEGLKELDTRDRNEVYSEEYLENALDELQGSDKE